MSRKSLSTIDRGSVNSSLEEPSRWILAGGRGRGVGGSRLAETRFGSNAHGSSSTRLSWYQHTKHRSVVRLRDAPAGAAVGGPDRILPRLPHGQSPPAGHR